MPNEEPKLGKELTAEEEQEVRDGNALLEMDTLNPGWKIIKDILLELMNHSWVDPRTCDSEKDFVWKEVNGFHAANNAKELLDTIQEKISRADYLSKVKSGEIDTRKFKI